VCKPVDAAIPAWTMPCNLLPSFLPSCKREKYHATHSRHRHFPDPFPLLPSGSSISSLPPILVHVSVIVASFYGKNPRKHTLTAPPATFNFSSSVFL
jgi:hypothetical protein